MVAAKKLNTVRQVLADLVYNTRRIGLRAAIDVSLRGLLYSREFDLVIAKSLDGMSRGEVAGSRPARALQIECIGLEHVDELGRLWIEENPHHTGVPRVLEHLHSGYDGFLIRHDGEAIGYFWWVAGPMAKAHPDPGIFQIGLRDADVYGFSYVISRHHRGKGLSVDALRAVEAELARLGYRRLWAAVDLANKPARWLYSVDRWQVSHRVKRTCMLGVHRSVVVDKA